VSCNHYFLTISLLYYTHQNDYRPHWTSQLN